MMPKQECSLDFETTAIKDDNSVERILGYSWSVRDGLGGYITKSSAWLGDESVAHLKRLARDFTLIFHSAQFELYILELFLGIEISSFHDTQVMSYVYNPALDEVAVPKANGKVVMQVHGLGAWGVRLGCHKLDNSAFDWTEWTADMAVYCEADAELTFKLFDHLAPLLRADEAGWSCYSSIDLPFVRAVVQMQHNGLKFSREQLKTFTQSREARCEELVKEILSICPIAPGATKKYKREKPLEDLGRRLGGLEYVGTFQEPDKRKSAAEGDTVDVYHYRVWEEFNPGSSKQVAWALQELYNWEPKKFTESGQPATGGETLEELEYPLAQLLCEFSHEQKLVDSFGNSLIAKLDEDDRVYPSINNCKTLTGRLSSSNPNVQQMPSKGDLGKEFRKTIVTRPGYKLVGADKSSFQLKILAYFLHAIVGNDAFWNHLKSGVDPHTATAAIVFGVSPSEVAKLQRSIGKQINFALAFGSGARKVAETLTKNGTPTTEVDASVYLDKVGDVMGLDILKYYIWSLGVQQGGLIHDLYGRRLFYPDLCSKDNAARSRAERQAFNAIIQGTEASILKMLTLESLRVIKEKGYRCRLLVNVHDENLYECLDEDVDAFSADLTAIFSNQEYLPGFGQAIEAAGSGDTWADAH